MTPRPKVTDICPHNLKCGIMIQWCYLCHIITRLYTSFGTLCCQKCQALGRFRNTSGTVFDTYGTLAQPHGSLSFGCYLLPLAVNCSILSVSQTDRQLDRRRLQLHFGINSALNPQDR
jgi:hypothetical protein